MERPIDGAVATPAEPVVRQDGRAARWALFAVGGGSQGRRRFKTRLAARTARERGAIGLFDCFIDSERQLALAAGGAAALHELVHGRGKPVARRMLGRCVGRFGQAVGCLNDLIDLLKDLAPGVLVEIGDERDEIGELVVDEALGEHDDVRTDRRFVAEYRVEHLHDPDTHIDQIAPVGRQKKRNLLGRDKTWITLVGIHDAVFATQIWTERARDIHPREQLEIEYAIEQVAQLAQVLVATWRQLVTIETELKKALGHELASRRQEKRVHLDEIEQMRVLRQMMQNRDVDHVFGQAIERKHGSRHGNSFGEVGG